MTLGGWITFAISAGGFTCFFAWCMYKVCAGGKGIHSHKDDENLTDNLE